MSLLKCPFCGNESDETGHDKPFHVIADEDNEHFTVACGVCFCTGPTVSFDNPDEATDDNCEPTQSTIDECVRLFQTRVQ